MKTQQHTYTPTSSASRLTSLCFNKIYTSHWQSSSRAFVAILYHASHSRFQISSFYTRFGYQSHSALYSKRSPLGFMSGEFSGHSRKGIPLHSRNVLGLLELCHSARSCIKIYPFYGNTTHLHESVFHSHNYRRHCRVLRKQNEKYHAKYSSQ